MAASSRRLLDLYRKCLKTAKRIPDPEQREVYRIYVRDGFHDKKDFLKDSRQALMAIQDAQDQLESMNYYLSVAELKNQQQSHGNDESLPEEAATETIETSGQHGDMDVSPRVHNDNMTERQSLVQQWLLEALPDLHNEDLTVYANRLVQDGFDSLDMLENELLVQDVDFMKKAHKRALARRKLPDKDAEKKR